MTFMMMQQRTRTICNLKLIAIFGRLEKLYSPNQIRRMRNSIISLDKGIVQIEVIIVRTNVHMNISEEFMIRECMRPFMKGSLNMDL